MQAAGADPIGASLVFLDLLKRQADRLTEPLLAEAEHVSAESDAGADMDVDRVWLFALSAAGAPGLWLHRHRLSTSTGSGSDLIRHPIDGGQQRVLTTD